MAFIAPAGTPISLGDILAGFAPYAADRGPANLHAVLCDLSETRNCWSFSSGRAAMVTALSVMRRLAGGARDQVIIPAYTCYSVPAAVERAGLHPVLCDVDPRTLSMSLGKLEQFDYSRVLAVVTANLYGLPNSLPAIEALARRKHVFMLDDAAQALGARIENRPVGGFGDVGLFSFDKGKNVTTIQGGALVSRNADFAREMDAAFKHAPACEVAGTMAAATKLVLYALLLRPHLYGMVRRLPGLGLGRTEYDTEYPITRLSGRLASIAAKLAARLADFNRTRTTNARRLSAALAGVAGIALPQLIVGAEPVYLRFPLFVEDPEKRDALLTALERQGIGATQSYPCSLADVPQVAANLVNAADGFDGARAVASKIITLPTHAYCPPDFPERVRATISSSAL